MNKQIIYNILRDGGFNRTGALAMLGNIGAESAFIPTNAENGRGWTDEEYTSAVDNGVLTRYDFAHDAIGYGLIQWTFYSRKEGLYDRAFEAHASIGSLQVQTNYILEEMARDFNSLYQYLCTTDDLYEATARVCTEFERPAVNNIETRYSIAVQCSTEVFDGESGEDDYVPPENFQITIRPLKCGCVGRDVFLLQCALKDMGFNLGSYGADGDFGSCTERALRQMQTEYNIQSNGIAGEETWQIIFQ